MSFERCVPVSVQKQGSTARYLACKQEPSVNCQPVSCDFGTLGVVAFSIQLASIFIGCALVVPFSGGLDSQASDDEARQCRVRLLCSICVMTQLLGVHTAHCRDLSATHLAAARMPRVPPRFFGLWITSPTYRCVRSYSSLPQYIFARLNGVRITRKLLVSQQARS
jgi:hypothetical protein